MLSIANLVKTFEDRTSAVRGEVRAVDDVSLEVGEGELVTMLGPSGCGKTTTLRSVAGLEQPDAGRIEVAERVLFDSRRRVNVPTHKRGLGMVFQSYAIWPHMNVYKNIEYALKGMKGPTRPKRADIPDHIDRVLELVRLEDLKDRQATKLSGGQQQRLALARALAVEPPVLLLDEPLSNLDLKLREQMRIELKRMQRELGITTLYVTHDQVEAMAISNKVAVMNDGKIEQVGTPREVYNWPATRFVAQFVGTINFLEGTVERWGDDGYFVGTPEGTIQATSVYEVAAGTKVTVSIRPENVQIEPGERAAGTNEWAGEVEAREFLGEAAEFRVRAGEAVVRVRSKAVLQLEPGEAVTLRFPPEWCAVIPEV